MFGHVDIDTFQIGQVKLANRALFEERQTRLPFFSIAKGAGQKAWIVANQLIHLALDRFNAFNLEAEMVELRRHGIMANDDNNHAR